jgi:hypothetical protein
VTVFILPLAICAASSSSSTFLTTDAFVRLRAYAYGNDLRLADVARDIVARRLRLFPDLPVGNET